MAAGLATLRELDREGSYVRLEALGASLEAHFARALQRAGVTASIARAGSILWISMQKGPPPRAFHRIDPAAAETYAHLHPRLLAQGLWMAPSYYEVAFVSLAHEEQHLQAAGEALEGALGEHLEKRA
jgi:glutamate-1-semialdehyde 2,1-aminomutase